MKMSHSNGEDVMNLTDIILSKGSQIKKSTHLFVPVTCNYKAMKTVVLMDDAYFYGKTIKNSKKVISGTSRWCDYVTPT